MIFRRSRVCGRKIDSSQEKILEHFVKSGGNLNFNVLGKKQLYRIDRVENRSVENILFQTLNIQSVV